MFIINIATFQDARKKLADPSTRQQGIDTLRKILEIKRAHLWRSEAIAPCCGNLGGFACQLNEETGLLEKALLMIEKGDLAAASPLLDRLGLLISYGMGQIETPELIERLTISTGQDST
ncbi:MAG: hypothetical protein WB588_08385 [Dehalococcoidia bacterium]